jgi:hypothetical protein
MKKKYFLFSLVLFHIGNVLAQNNDEAKKIAKDYNIEKISSTARKISERDKERKKLAISVAKQKKWPIIIRNENGIQEELMRLTPDGFPIYYSTQNQDAAKSTRTNHLNSGGSLGLNLDGQGMVARVWDGGTVRRTHQFLSNRIETVDDGSSTFNQHATHVTGTIISNASGASSNLKGMAPEASARTFNWTDDSQEALMEVQDGMLLSNHSYGVPVTSNSGQTLPAWYIGSYVEDARVWDEIAYNAPYYLAVVSAGNDGNNNNNTNPILYGYDKLTENKVCKNNLVVANAEDVLVNNDGTLATGVNINSSSSQGPTDDRRIKPDVTGNGTGVLSASHLANNSTATLTGTSMAAPNVTGTLLLVQQHYKNLHQKFLKASTLKGLACHTADDSGYLGPDPNFGWGLLNGKAMVETINNNLGSTYISENILNQNQTLSFTVTSDGSKPLKASITWTDYPGNAIDSSVPANSLNKALINDLDIRITKDGNTYYPWKLQNDPSLEAIRNTDNDVDNVELVQIDSPQSGTYTVNVSHKGALIDGLQNYSLIVTGITSNSLSNTKNEFNTLKVYPNPTKGILNIDLREEFVGAVMTVFDIQGRKITSNTLNSNSEIIDMNGFENGIYFVSIENDFKKSTKKVVLAK